MSEIISKIWSKIKDDVYARLKEAASMLLEGLKQRASTLDGKYSITVGVQMLALLIIGLMTIAYGYTSAIYGASIILFLLMFTRDISEDAFKTYFQKNHLQEAFYEKDEVFEYKIGQRSLTPSRYVLYLGLLHIVLCLLVDMLVRHKDTTIGLTAIVLCIVVVVGDFLLDKFSEEMSEQEDFSDAVETMLKECESVVEEETKTEE